MEKDKMKRCEFIFPIDIIDKELTVGQYKECIKTPIITNPPLKFFDAQRFINYINRVDTLRTFPQEKDYGWIRAIIRGCYEEGRRGPLPPNEAFPVVYDSVNIIQDGVSGHDCYPGNFYFTTAKDSNKYCEEMFLKIKWREFFIPRGEYKIKVASEENKPLISTYILRDLRFKQEDLSKVLPLDKMLYGSRK